MSVILTNLARCSQEESYFFDEEKLQENSLDSSEVRLKDSSERLKYLLVTKFVLGTKRILALRRQTS